ncbi:MAG: hypothetical protein EBU52_08930, partial [Cytophagia bacterium]|nr:hypothetical protein [Cytophagia bacterium]
MKLLMRFLAILLFLPALVWAQSKNNYNYTLDLTKVEDDKVYVELTPPVIKESEITFYFPKMIPGTYAIEDYGRFVSKLEVLDKKGKKLSVSKVDDNSWKIKEADKAAKITYWIEDTFDTKLKGPEVFWPAGTNIEEGKNFLINSSGFFGYFEGYKDKPFTLNVIRAENFYGSTGLIAVKTGEPLTKVTKEEKDNSAGKRVDIFQTENYDRLVDSPIMYSEPDTAIIYVG